MGWPSRRLQYLRATLSSGSLSGKREDAIVAPPATCIREREVVDAKDHDRCVDGRIVGRGPRSGGRPGCLRVSRQESDGRADGPRQGGVPRLGGEADGRRSREARLRSGHAATAERRVIERSGQRARRRRARGGARSDVRRCRGRGDPGRGHRSAYPRRPRATGDGGAASGEPAGLSAAKDAAPELRPRLQRLPHRPRLLRAVAAPASLALLTSAARATGAGGVGGGVRSPDPYLLRVGEAEDLALVAGQSGHVDRDSAWSGERTPPPTTGPAPPRAPKIRELGP